MIMNKKTFRYSLLLKLINIFLVAFPAFSFAQQTNITEIQNPEEKPPLYRGSNISVDLFGVGSKLFGGDFLSTEVSLEANLKHKYFPIVEIGFGTTNATEDTYNMHYKTSAPYARIGLNYNMMSKSGTNNYLYLGLRYGFAPLKYDVWGPDMQDGIWKEDIIPFSYLGEKSSAHWGEFLVGVKAEIYKNILMGWTLRYKARINVKENANTTPWYIPGYGKNKSTLFGFTYTVIYTLPF